MKIQISNKRIVKDALTVWNEHGPEVDVVMDPKQLSFRPGSIDAIFAFHVIEHFFQSEVNRAVQNWYSILKPGGELFITTDDIEFVARSLIAGDISIDAFNERHAHPMQFSKDSIVALFKRAGFNENEIRIWNVGIEGLIPKDDYELLLAAKRI